MMFEPDHIVVIDGIEYQPKERANTVSIHGMYDCHLFHRFEGASVREIADSWIAHCKVPHPAKFEDRAECIDLGPTSLGPAIVLQDERELRRVGCMVFYGQEGPDMEALEKWIAALEADPDIPRILREHMEPRG